MGCWECSITDVSAHVQKNNSFDSPTRRTRLRTYWWHNGREQVQPHSLEPLDPLEHSKTLIQLERQQTLYINANEWQEKGISWEHSKSHKNTQFSKARRRWLKSACLQALCKTKALLITAATCISAFFPLFSFRHFHHQHGSTWTSKSTNEMYH